MNSCMRLKPLQFALLLAFASAPASVLAAGPYPHLPPSLSTSVAPNIIFYLDTSGSMLQDVNNQWMRTDLCDPNGSLSWDSCVNRGPEGVNKYKTAVDSEPNSKMNIAKRVTKSVVQKLVDANLVTDPVTGVVTKKGEVRVGLFSFHDWNSRTEHDGRAKGSILRAPVTDVSVKSNQDTFEKALGGLSGRTSTPLGEGLLEITQYLRGGPSLYDKPTYPSLSSVAPNTLVLGGSYVSPIQYRCQRNVAIVVTDGNATNDDVLPKDPPYTYTWETTNSKGEIVKHTETFSEPHARPIKYITWDEKGDAVTKTFRVCSEANEIRDNDSDVNCPAVLEGTITSPNFDDGSNTSEKEPIKQLPNRFRALRDVAKYARVADLRPEKEGSMGIDLDGKSFNDSRFLRQNLNTYTVGFSVESPVLLAAAIAGQGKSYNVKKEEALREALTDAVNSIGAFTSNAGGLATQSDVSKAGNKLFQPVFNPSGWRGELRCFPLDAQGKRQFNYDGTPIVCAPNAIANIPTPDPTGTGGRNLFTSKRDPSTELQAEVSKTPNATVRFNFADTVPGQYSPSQLKSLGADDTEQKQTINYVRGVDLAGTRSRSDPVTKTQMLLGDIIDGQPLVVSEPSGATFDKTYSAFKADNASRNIVLIGANDGMLHAFRVDESASGKRDNMREIMGYIPSAVYPNLKALKSPNYGTAAEPHTYHVNGSLRQADVKLFNGESIAWTTVVAGGLGQGGQGYFALDVKNADQLAKANNAENVVKWEFTDLQHDGMGYSFGAPIIYNVHTSDKTVTPAVIVSNGYDSDFDDTTSGGARTATKASVLYIINAETGALIRAIDVPASIGGGGGLSSPAGVDVGHDGILDYVYAGDLNGKMWRFDLTEDQPSKFFVATNPIFDAGPERPITSRPAIMPVNKASNGDPLGNIVLFGTGKLLTDADRSSTTTQYLYGILDKMEPTPTTVPNTVSADSLQEQTINGLYTDPTPRLSDGYLQSYRRMSNNFIDLRSDTTNAFRGWRIPLPTSGERNVSAPNVFEDVVFFATGTPVSAEKCSPGSGWVMGLNPLTGSSVRVRNAISGAEYSFIDLTGDNRSSEADRRPFPGVPGSAGPTTTQDYASGYSLSGIPTELSFLFRTLSVPAASTNEIYKDAGSAIALRESNLQSVYSVDRRSGKSYVSPRPSEVQWGLLGDGGTGSSTVPPSLVNAKVFSTIWREIKN
jgi:type IV pilus assembly protein PilY1